MGEVSLFEHNEIAYRKMCEALKSNKCVAVNHATGTGKSFIALKYLFENRHKKFLYLAPSYPILEQLIRDCSKIGISPDEINVDRMIYRGLLSDKIDINELYQKYDGFIFDEYHRCGAKQTYIKIKQLKSLLAESGDDKKIIGLTATPKRYLDNERNMTEELFDGIEASKITLSEAMLEDLLPIPWYFVPKEACVEEFQNIFGKVSRLAEGEEKEDLRRELSELGKDFKDINVGFKKVFQKNITQKDGKYIVFCSTVSEAEKYYGELDKWFPHIGKIKKYMVNSYRNKRENQKDLNAFNNQKEGFGVLVCVDVLNEGVHVDDIDGVILLRKTQSPIIYFQQIGRALSFSGRDKEIKIFDFVNNYNGHNAIYALYKEFLGELKARLTQSPESKKEYEKKFKRFQIVDETIDFLKKLEEFKSKLTIENLANMRINYAIKKFENIIKKNSEETYPQLSEDDDIRKAYDTISKYYKYVTNDQLKILFRLRVLLPPELMISWEERQESLKGFPNFYEKEKHESEICITEVIEFIKNKGFMPQIDSKDEVERTLAQKYLAILPNLDENTMLKLKEKMIEEDIVRKPYEKALFEERVTPEEINELIKIAEPIALNNNALPTYLYRALFNVFIRYNTSQVQEIADILRQSDDIEKEMRAKAETKRQEIITELSDFFKEQIDKPEKEILTSDVFEKLGVLSNGDRNYIKRKYRNLKRQYYRDIVKEDEPDMERFCRRVRDIKPERITGENTQLEKEKIIYNKIRQVLDFIAQNKSECSNENFGDEIRTKIEFELDEVIKTGTVTEKIMDLSRNSGGLWYSVENAIKEIVEDRMRILEAKVTILKCAEFFHKNCRNPLINSRNEDEKNLASEYQKVCTHVLNDREIYILNRTFNSNKALNRTIREYARNIKEGANDEQEI